VPTLTEKIDSREWTTGERPSVTMHYVLDGTSDDLTAKALLLSSTPAEYDGLARDDCSLEPIFVDTAAGAGKWDCRVRYVAPEQKEPQVGESSFSFDTGGGTQHISQSLQTVASHAPPGKTVLEGSPPRSIAAGSPSRAPSASPWPPRRGGSTSGRGSKRPRSGVWRPPALRRRRGRRLQSR